MHRHSLGQFPVSYYNRTWGFCISHDQYLKMEKDPAAEYEVCIDSEIKKGVMRIGEWFLPGETDQEILLSTNICHPCMANDNLSNAVVATAVAKEIAKWPKRKFSYRLLVLPATVGCIAYIYNNPGWVEKIYGAQVGRLGARTSPHQKCSAKIRLGIRCRRLGTLGHSVWFVLRSSRRNRRPRQWRGIRACY